MAFRSPQDSLREGFGDVDLAQRDQPFVFCFKLGVVLVGQIKEFVTVDELEIPLAQMSIPRSGPGGLTLVL